MFMKKKCQFMIYMNEYVESMYDVMLNLKKIIELLE